MVLDIDKKLSNQAFAAIERSSEYDQDPIVVLVLYRFQYLSCPASESRRRLLPLRFDHRLQFALISGYSAERLEGWSARKPLPRSASPGPPQNRSITLMTRPCHRFGMLTSWSSRTVLRTTATECLFARDCRAVAGNTGRSAPDAADTIAQRPCRPLGDPVFAVKKQFDQLTQNVPCRSRYTLRCDPLAAWNVLPAIISQVHVT